MKINDEKDINKDMNLPNCFHDFQLDDKKDKRVTFHDIIQENNDYILSHITEELGQITVINYFNGQEIALQDMLDILASYHLADPLTYTLLASKNKTYTELAAYNMTYSQYINSGNAIIV